LKPVLYNITNKTIIQHCSKLLAGLAIAGLFFTAACNNKNTGIKADITRQLQVIDSLRLNGQPDTAVAYLTAMQKQYGNKSALFTSAYYRIKSEKSRNDEVLMNLYADSALAVFDTEENRLLYPREYFKSLIAKGVACIVNRKYNLGLQYYYKAGDIEYITDCDRAELLSGLGGLYFDQQNYQLAGHTWYASYVKRAGCHDEIPEREFLIEQGTLDNAGLAYERAGLLDSAAFCYRQDISLITSYNGKVTDRLIAPAYKVVYDNLGGLYLKQQQFDSAGHYLNKSVNTRIYDTSAANVPPLLKLAELYTLTGDVTKAHEAFNKSRQLLDYFTGQNPNSQVKWYKLYGALLLKDNNPAEAYKYLDRYVQYKDSVDKGLSALLTLNVGHEFNTLRQENTLNELKIKDKINQVYLWAIVVIVILSIVIIVLVYRNLTKSRKNYNDTIAHNQKLQKTLEELESVNKNYIRVMRVMAHDLRNPLGGITGITAMVLRDDEGLSAESRHMLKLVESTGNHSMEMINELLRSGLAGDNEVIEMEKFDLANLLYSTVELLQFKAKEKNQTLQFSGSQQPVIATINHEKIWRVFNNIIVNAIKFTHQGGTITVCINRQGNRGVIIVMDDGVGIPDKDKPYVFDMFTSAKKNGTGDEKPFGLGLSISKRIVEKHNGKIWFESVKEQGTTFYIELPLD